MTQQQILELFDYKFGSLYWKKKIAKKIIIGAKAGTFNKKIKRIIIGINGKYYHESALIYKMFNGEYEGVIDHININCSDNNIENLRAVSQRDNSINRGVVINNKRQLPPCVYYDPTNKKNHYYVRARVNGRKKVVAWGVTPNEAYDKYVKMFNITI